MIAPGMYVYDDFGNISMKNFWDVYRLRDPPEIRKK